MTSHGKRLVGLFLAILISFSGLSLLRADAPPGGSPPPAGGETQPTLGPGASDGVPVPVGPDDGDNDNPVNTVPQPSDGDHGNNPVNPNPAPSGDAGGQVAPTTVPTTTVTQAQQNIPYQAPVGTTTPESVVGELSFSGVSMGDYADLDRHYYDQFPDLDPAMKANLLANLSQIYSSGFQGQSTMRLKFDQNGEHKDLELRGQFSDLVDQQNGLSYVADGQMGSETSPANFKVQIYLSPVSSDGSTSLYCAYEGSSTNAAYRIQIPDGSVSIYGNGHSRSDYVQGISFKQLPSNDGSKRVTALYSLDAFIQIMGKKGLGMILSPEFLQLDSLQKTAYIESLRQFVNASELVVPVEYGIDEQGNFTGEISADLAPFVRLFTEAERQKSSGAKLINEASGLLELTNIESFQIELSSVSSLESSSPIEVPADLSSRAQDLSASEATSSESTVPSQEAAQAPAA
ncbi:MAG: hypothetical protein Q4P72_01810 [Eubacteriales bacterium]|nr:hypothetical protein [Eubacteriales bacterium]